MYAKRVEAFIANAPNRTRLGEGVKQNFAVVEAMVKAHPCLKIDFQVYLRNDGAVLNIDLDRCDKLELGISRESEPLDEGHRLRLAQIPGVCQRGRDGNDNDQRRHGPFTLADERQLQAAIWSQLGSSRSNASAATSRFGVRISLEAETNLRQIYMRTSYR